MVPFVSQLSVFSNSKLILCLDITDMKDNLKYFSIVDPVTNLATYFVLYKIVFDYNIVCHFLLILKGRLAASQYGYINCFSNSFYKCHTIKNAVFFLLQMHKT